MGGVLAELLISEGRRVTLVTPSARVSEWADHTMEQERIQGRLMELGVELLTSKGLLRGALRAACGWAAPTPDVRAISSAMRCCSSPRDCRTTSSAHSLAPGPEARSRAVGDAYSPGTIAAAVWDGRRYAEELDDRPSPATTRRSCARCPSWPERGDPHDVSSPERNH